MRNFSVLLMGLLAQAAPALAGTKTICDIIAYASTKKGSTREICTGVFKGYRGEACTGTGAKVCEAVSLGFDANPNSCSSLLPRWYDPTKKKGNEIITQLSNHSLFRYRVCRGFKNTAATEEAFATIYGSQRRVQTRSRVVVPVSVTQSPRSIRQLMETARRDDTSPSEYRDSRENEILEGQSAAPESISANEVTRLIFESFKPNCRFNTEKILGPNPILYALRMGVHAYGRFADDGAEFDLTPFLEPYPNTQTRIAVARNYHSFLLRPSVRVCAPTAPPQTDTMSYSQALIPYANLAEEKPSW